MTFPNGHRTCAYGDVPCRAIRCDGVMVPRTNRENGQRFYGCSNYPKCENTRRWADVEEEITFTLVENGDPDDPAWELSR